MTRLLSPSEVVNGLLHLGTCIKLPPSMLLTVSSAELMQHIDLQSMKDSCVSRNGGTEEVGWYTQRVKKAWLCLGLAVTSHGSQKTVTVTIGPPCCVQG